MDNETTIILRDHIMNDSTFGKTTVDVQPNCVVQPLLEIVTCVGIKNGEELLIRYNRN